MSRNLKKKELIQTRLAANYGGWMYCTSCQKNIGYLCYATYDTIDLQYECMCGSKGSVIIEFEDSKTSVPSNKELILVRNRFCCPEEKSPLITLLARQVKNYQLKITCKACYHQYQKESMENS